MTTLPARRILVGRWRESWSAEWKAFRARRSQWLQPYPFPSKLQISLWALATIISAALTLLNFDSFQLGAYDDDAEYVVLARSLVEAEQFGAIYNPGQPGKAIFPFGFPLLLAPVVWAFPGNVDALKSVSLVATLINIGLIFWGWPWLSRSTSRWWAVAIMLAYSLSPLVTSQAHMVMSEPAFTTCLLVACILAERISRGGNVSRWIILFGITLLALCAIRSVGLIFSAGLILDLLIVLGRLALKLFLLALAAALVALTLLVAVTPLQIADVLSPNQRYVSDFYAFTQNRDTWALDQGGVSAFPIRLAERVYRHFTRELRSTVLAGGGGQQEKELFTRFGLPWLSDMIGLIIGSLVVAGIVYGFWREGGSAFLIGAFLYLSSLIFWNWTGDRFLYPILPQLLLGLFLAINGLTRLATRPLSKTARQLVPGVITGIAVGLVAGSFVYRTFRLEPSIHHTGDLTVRTDWISTHTEQDAIIASEFPAVDFLYGERQVIGIPRALGGPDDPLDAWRLYLISNQVDYVLVAPSLYWNEIYTPRYSPKMMMLMKVISGLEATGQVVLVHETSGDLIKVYRVVQQ